MLGEDFDLEIVETHHRLKKDAPSGTAKRLAEILCEVRKLDYAKNVAHGREGMIGERSAGEIGVHSIRGGDVVGDHTVTFAGRGERLELTHKASSRETFAAGRVARRALDRRTAAGSLQHGRCAWTSVAVAGVADPGRIFEHRPRPRPRLTTMRAGVALGSNLGDRLANLRNARKEIAALGNVLPPMRSSAIYETEPVGCEEGAAKFLNAAIEFEYAGEPQDLRRDLAEIEEALGRPSSHTRERLPPDRSRFALFRRFGDRDCGVAGAASAHLRTRIRPPAARRHSGRNWFFQGRPSR